MLRISRTWWLYSWYCSSSGLMALMRIGERFPQHARAPPRSIAEWTSGGDVRSSQGTPGRPGALLAFTLIVTPSRSSPDCSSRPRSLRPAQQPADLMGRGRAKLLLLMMIPTGRLARECCSGSSMLYPRNRVAARCWCGKEVQADFHGPWPGAMGISCCVRRAPGCTSIRR